MPLRRTAGQRTIKTELNKKNKFLEKIVFASKRRRWNLFVQSSKIAAVDNASTESGSKRPEQFFSSFQLSAKNVETKNIFADTYGRIIF